MPFDPENKILFVHIPKTAGTSIERFFDLCRPERFWFDRWDRDQERFIDEHRERVDPERLKYEPQHYTPEILRMLIKDYEAYFKFTFVRNPYTKLLSEYFWLNQKEFRQVSDFDPSDFERWCFAFLERVDNSHQEPQVNFIDDSIDFVGRFEHLHQDFGCLLGILEKRPLLLKSFKNRILPLDNSTGKEKSVLIPYITGETKAFIVDKFAHDFILLGYDPQL